MAQENAEPEPSPAEIEESLAQLGVLRDGVLWLIEASS
jgi:hypothetical protein